MRKLVTVCAVLVMTSVVSADIFVITPGGDVNYGTSLLNAINAANSGDVIEIRDSGTYTAPEGFNSLVFQVPDVTLRSIAGQKATILDPSGGMDGTFEVNAANVTFENLIIENSVLYGTYAFWFGGTKDAARNYPSKGMTVRNVEFIKSRGVIIAGSGWVTDLTFVDNVVNDTDYGLGKSGMNYGSGCVITGNTFTKNGTMADKSDPAQPTLWLESLAVGASVTISNNTFSDTDGRYAIYSDEVDIADLTMSGNVFNMTSGGTGAELNLVPLGGGGHAIGVVPEPATMSLLALGGLAVLRRRRRGSA